MTNRLSVLDPKTTDLSFFIHGIPAGRFGILDGFTGITWNRDGGNGDPYTFSTLADAAAAVDALNDIL